MSWHVLPTELHLAVIHHLPHHDVCTFSAASSTVRTLCLPAIFAHVSLASAASLDAFVRHVPARYGEYVRSLTICTKHQSGRTGAPTTDPILALLESCTRLHSLSLSLASSLDPEKAVSAFARLDHLQSFEIGCWGREDVAPVSERLVVALAAALPSLIHLSLSRITRSAIHVDPCDVPYNVPIVTNDVDVPPHPVFGSDLALPTILRLTTLRSLDIRDTWLGCDTHLDLVRPAQSALERLVITGSMYTSDTETEKQTCTTWLSACPPLRSLELGTALAPLSDQQPAGLPRVTHVHINASRVLPNALSSTLDVLTPCHLESISIGYEHAPDDEFARECALDDLQDWSDAIDAFLAGRSEREWRTLSRVEVSLAQDVCASWDV